MNIVLDQMVVSAMVEFGSGLRDLQSQFITPDMAEQFQSYYEKEFFSQLTQNIGGTLDYNNYRPSSQGGQYLLCTHLSNSA